LDIRFLPSYSSSRNLGLCFLLPSSKKCIEAWGHNGLSYWLLFPRPAQGCQKRNRKKTKKTTLRRKNKVLGYGITEIPKNSKNRACLEGILEKIFTTEQSNYHIRLEESLKSKKEKK